MLLGRLLRETSGSMATEEPMAVGAEAPMQGEAMQGEAPAAQASEESLLLIVTRLDSLSIVVR